jgi:phenylacetate-CoA ligase
MMFSSSYYKRSPAWAQEWMISARAFARGALREGRAFRRDGSELEQSQWLDAAGLQRLQADRLQAIVGHAAAHVPYWRERFAALKLDAARLDLPRDMERLPLLDKNDVRAAGMSLVADEARRPLVSGSTSGTTGSPVWFHQDLQAITRENAFIWRQLRWAGMQPGDRRAWIRGEPVVPPDHVEPPFWRHNRSDNMLMMSSLHLSDANAALYIDALREYDPAVIQAYPSSICYLAAWMDGQGLRYQGRSLKSIVTSSEMFDREQREQVARVFGCKVFDWYGLVERVAAIGMCEHGRYHVISDYSHVEFVPAGDGYDELVGTSFNNFAMPLLRYRCGDLVKRAPLHERCACGRAFPLIDDIIGRADDFIKLPDGRRMAACLAGNMFRGVPGVLEGQIRQDDPDRLTVLVVPGRGYTELTAQKLQSNARARIGASLGCEVKLVDEIPRTARGKFKSVVCNV